MAPKNHSVNSKKECNWLTIHKQKKEIKHACKSILDSLNAFCLTKETEDIHRLRVAIKKLNAIITLLPLRKRTKRKLLKPIRKIFKTSSAIRTAEVNLELMREFKLKDPIYEMEQREIINQISDLIISKKSKYTLWLRNFHSSFEPFLNKLSSETLQAIFLKRLNKLQLYFSKKPETSLLHKTRKALKIQLYLYPVIEKFLEEGRSINIEYLDELQDKIGKWHDVELTIDSLKERLIPNTVLPKLMKLRTKLLNQIFIYTSDFSIRVYSS